MTSLRLTLIALLSFGTAGAAVAQGSDDWTACTTGTDFDKTIAVCTTVISSGQETGPRLAKIYLARAIMEIWKGAIDKSFKAPAIADLSQSIALDPTPTALINRGEFYYEDGRYADSAADFKQAADLDPKEGPHVQLGMSYEHLGETKLAQAAYDAMVAHNRKDPGVYTARGDFYRRGNKPALAIADYKKALRLEPKGYRTYENADVEYRLGLAEREKGDEKAAAKDIADANSIYPGMQPPSESY